MRKLGFREVVRSPKATQLEVAGAAPSQTLSPGPPGPAPAREQHLTPVAPSSLRQQRSPRRQVTLHPAQVPLLTLRPHRHPHSSTGSWHPAQATCTSRKPCGPRSETLSTQHGAPSPVSSSLEWAPAGLDTVPAAHPKYL